MALLYLAGKSSHWSLFRVRKHLFITGWAPLMSKSHCWHCFVEGEPSRTVSGSAGGCTGLEADSATWPTSLPPHWPALPLPTLPLHSLCPPILYLQKPFHYPLMIQYSPPGTPAVSFQYWVIAANDLLPVYRGPYTWFIRWTMNGERFIFPKFKIFFHGSMKQKHFKSDHLCCPLPLFIPLLTLSIPSPNFHTLLDCKIHRL